MNALSIHGVGLHDALLQSAEFGQDYLTLSLVCGDLQKGYHTVTINYREPSVNAPTLSTLWAGTRGEVLEDSLTELPSGFSHRLTFLIYGSRRGAEISCTDYETDSRLRTSREEE